MNQVTAVGTILAVAILGTVAKSLRDIDYAYKRRIK